MESSPQSLTALLRGSPWYESALRGARSERTVVLWLRLGTRARLEGFVGQVVARDGARIGGPLIGGTVWSNERGVRGPVLDDRRREISDAWAEIERRLGGATTIVGHRLATLRSQIMGGLPSSIRGSLHGATWVDLHEAASLLRRSRLADASGRSLLETRSASLRDLAALAGKRVSDEQIERDDLLAGEIVTAIWASVLLPRFGKIPIVTREVSEDPIVPPAPPTGRSTLPREIEDILGATPDASPAPVIATPPPAQAATPSAPPTTRSYHGQPAGEGWTVTRDDGTVLADRLRGGALARALLADLDGGVPDPLAVERLTTRVIDALPADVPFSIGAADLRALSA